jgi:hypothetical protein
MPMRFPLVQLAAPPSEHADFLTCPRCGTQMPKVVTIAHRWDANRGWSPTSAQMRVCDERLGVKRDGPPDGSGPGGTRRCCRLTHPIFHPRNIRLPPSTIISAALGLAIPGLHRRPRRRGDRIASVVYCDCSQPLVAAELSKRLRRI